MMDIRGKRVLLVGLARSGRAAALALARQGAIVTVTDRRGPAEFQNDLPLLLKEKIGLELGAHRESTFLRQDLIIVSPGVFPDPPALEAARRRGIPIVPEIEAASWFLKGTLLGVTGSNGKTTTTTLLGKMLEASGFPTFVAGNIGTPLSAAIGQVTPESMVVAELSSFQLERVRDFRTHVAVLLNLSPNHLDRHPDFESYVRAKARIFRNQKQEDFAVLNADDPVVMSLASAIQSRKIFFSRQRRLADGLFVADGSILYGVRNLERPLLHRKDVRLRGEFNLENVLAAAAAACVVGADFEAIRQAVREFKGVEHRLELVGEVRGVEFYNNSKATSVAATVNSLEAFERGVHLILGGKDKGAPYEPIRQRLPDRVRAVYLIGAAAGRIEKELSGAAVLVPCGDLQTAVRQAFERSWPGDIVLLAPACSSFDQFRDYEERGRVFKELVRQLADRVAREEAAAPRSAQDPPPGEKTALQAPPAEQNAATASEGKTVAVTSTEATPPASAPTQEAPNLPPVDTKAGASPEPPELLPSANNENAPQVSGRPDLIYIYEVGAEESKPAESQDMSGPSPDELALDSSTPSQAIENPEDEPLPYEARAKAAGAAGDSRQRSGGTAKKDPDIQARLPGI
ncbi:MAG TPA: UDP-N-acetylmuramoyl-L-alanine--D-glutamate ligase [Terriglobia bacterium]|nr:UDP-N-acetylmuramoyl-L-alanine--D-glutamate ligase [Terriglobia bacterium]